MRSLQGKALITAIMTILSISSATLSALAANPGELSFRWTAPGDDGYVGTSNHYVIKYSTSPISESNWASATTVPNPPTPLPAGSIQNMTVTGLGIGQQYYIALKAYDEANNVSLLSSVIQKFSGGIMAPTLVGSRVDSLGNSTLISRTVRSGMSLYYQFALDTLATFSRPSFAADTVTDSLAAVTFLSLRRNDWYYWRCRAMAMDRSDSSQWSRTDSFFVAPFNDNMAPRVTVTSPDGRERWIGNTVHNITWTDTDNTGITAHKLEYSTDSGMSWVLIRNWTSGDPHVFAWTVPNIASRSCRVRVTCQDASANVGYDMSNRDFTIHRGNTVMSLDTVNPDPDLTALPGTSDDTLMALQGGLIDPQNPIPGEYYLAQSYPNPFNPTTTISYGLPNASHVTIDVYDMLGRKVQNIVDENQQAGVHQVNWNGTQMASGTYLYRIQAGNFIQTMKMQLLK